MKALMIFVMAFFGVQAVNAQSTPTSAPASAPGKTSAAAKAESSQTEHSFEDLLVQGKYHFSDESLTTVEEDKVLNALIGVRQDFKDRLESSATKN
jgi:hypothetical protein